jgi:hypothetical protein
LQTSLQFSDPGGRRGVLRGPDQGC